MLRTVDPDLLQMMGQQPLNPEQMAAGNPNLPPGPMNQETQMNAPQNQANSQVMDQSMMGPQANIEEMIPGQPEVNSQLLPNPNLDPRAR